jgi:hypothetical protein
VNRVMGFVSVGREVDGVIVVDPLAYFKDGFRMASIHFE